MLNILGNTIFNENNTQRTEEFHECFRSQNCWKFRKEFSSTFGYAKNMSKYAKFGKYAKPKVFMPTTSKNEQSMEHIDATIAFSRRCN